MTIFISYARANMNAVVDLRAGLGDFGHESFYDGDIFAGENWWDEILGQIRSCRAFIFALSPESARSTACGLELEYALELGKPVVPLMVKTVDHDDAPQSLLAHNIKTFIDPSQADYGKLDQRLDELVAETSPLPETLPKPPVAPITDLSAERDAVRQEHLDPAQQAALVVRLAEVAENEDDCDAAVAVLRMLRSHRDFDESLHDAVDEVLKEFSRNRIDAKSRLRLDRLLSAISKGQCLPILGHGMNEWLLGSRAQLARKWAKKYDFPMNTTRRDDLPQVAQYVSVLLGSNDDLHAMLREFYRDGLFERFGEILGPDRPVDGVHRTIDDLIIEVWQHERAKTATDPYAVLASLECRIYITTEKTSLLAVALTEAGRTPRVDYCQWNPAVEKWPEPDPETAPPSNFVPTLDEPLVYHLFGTFDVPESIVVTEDEYFDFLASVASQPALIPLEVRTAFAESLLLILGFGLQDWGIRVLLRSIINPETAGHASDIGHVAAEYDVDRSVVSRQEARKYLEDYFGKHTPHFHIFWSAVEQFFSDLYTEWSMRNGG